MQKPTHQPAHNTKYFATVIIRNGMWSIKHELCNKPQLIFYSPTYRRSTLTYPYEEGTMRWSSISQLNKIDGTISIWLSNFVSSQNGVHPKLRNQRSRTAIVNGPIDRLTLDNWPSIGAKKDWIRPHGDLSFCINAKVIIIEWRHNPVSRVMTLNRSTLKIPPFSQMNTSSLIVH